MAPLCNYGLPAFLPFLASCHTNPVQVLLQSWSGCVQAGEDPDADSNVETKTWTQNTALLQAWKIYKE